MLNMQFDIILIFLMTTQTSIESLLYFIRFLLCYNQGYKVFPVKVCVTNYAIVLGCTVELNRNRWG